MPRIEGNKVFFSALFLLNFYIFVLESLRLLAAKSRTRITFKNMLGNTWNAIIDWFRDRSERSNLVRSFNESARNAFVSGIAPTLLKASISKGERSYKHQFSSWFNTGFRIQAFTGRVLSKDELVLIGKVILSDGVLTRRLVVLGWDTLEIHGDSGAYGCRWQLRDHIALPNFERHDIE